MGSVLSTSFLIQAAHQGARDDNEVTKLEESVLFFSNAQRLNGPWSKFWDHSSARSIVQTPIVSPNGSGITIPSLTCGPSPSLSSKDSKCFSFGHSRLLNLLNFSDSGNFHIQELTHFDNDLQVVRRAARSCECMPLLPLLRMFGFFGSTVLISAQAPFGISLAPFAAHRIKYNLNFKAD